MNAFILVAMSIGILMASQSAQACLNMTAALRMAGKSYLFFGQNYMTLKEDADTGKYAQDGAMRDVYEDWGLSWPDAVVVWSVDQTDYWFSDEYYFSYWNNYAPRELKYFGRRRNLEPFFKSGLDAAGDVNGVTIFLARCHYVVSGPSRLTNPIPLPKNVPCSVDAALTHGKELWLFKYDKIWKMTAEGLKDGMPVDFDTEFTLDDDMYLCPQSEDDAQQQ